MLAQAAHGRLGNLDLALVVAYMSAMMLVGLRFSRSSKNTEDYLLGGRSIPWWLAAVSYLMTLLSTISMVAVPGEAYDHGVTLAVQQFIAPLLAVGAFHIFIRFYFQSRMFTPFDYLERRFDARIRALAAGFYYSTRVIYLGLALFATSTVFEGACGWPRWQTILLTGGIGVAYTVLGGLHAVAWTDLIQFVVLVGGMLVLLGKICLAVPGGALGILEYSFAQGHGPTGLSDPSFYSISPYVRLSLWGLVIFIANDQLFYNSSDQMAIQRLLSTSSYRQARRSLYSCAAMQLPVFLGLWFVGLAIFAFYGLLPPDQRPLHGKSALYHFIGTHLPAPLPGLMIAAMLAAVMSTLAGGFNSLTTVATVDFYQRFFRPVATQREQVAFSRVMTVLLGAASIGVGLGLTLSPPEQGFVDTSFTWLSLVSSLTPVFLLGVFSRRVTGGQALIALAVAVGVSVFMLARNLTLPDERRISFLYLGVPGPALALLTAFILSRFSPPMSPARLRNLTWYTIEPSPESEPTLTPAAEVARPAPFEKG
jgi:SSS family transporter